MEDIVRIDTADFTRNLRHVWWLALLLILLAGCPSGEDGQAQDATSDQVANLPSTGDWIVPRKLQYYANDLIAVDYRLERNDSTSPAWIAMVPVDTDSLSAGDNFAAQVEYTLVHEFPQGTKNFHARENGEYRLRLFAAKRDDAVMIAQSDVLRIGSPEDEQRQLDPPYVTLSGNVLPEEIVLRPGMVIAAYWMLDEPLPDDAWLGMIPASCRSSDAAANYAAAVEPKKLGGKTSAASRFALDQTGEFVFRIFPSTASGAEMVCESERFIVSADMPAGE
jgi:hypothetical protein